jgi:hypothetical protein
MCNSYPPESREAIREEDGPEENYNLARLCPPLTPSSSVVEDEDAQRLIMHRGLRDRWLFRNSVVAVVCGGRCNFSASSTQSADDDLKENSTVYFSLRSLAKC